MGIVEQLGTKMKKAVMSKPTLEELDASIVKAEAAALEAAKAAQRARDAFTVGWDDLAAAGDELGIRRLREEITAAERTQQHAEADVALHRGRREKLRAANAQALHDEAVTEFERTAQLLYVRDQTIVDLVHKLADEIEARGLIATDLQRLVDTLLVRQRTAALSMAANPKQEEAARKLRTAISANEYPALFDNTTVLHLIALELYIRTHGKWPHRNIGLDVYSLSQGPKFDDRSRDYLRLLQRNLIELGIVPQPPPSAA